MSVDAANFKKAFPEFADVPNVRLTIFSGMAERNVNRSVWEEKADDAEMLLTAHFLTLADRQGAGGAVTQERVGDLSVSYGTSKGNQDELNSTSYGQMFLMMMKTLAITPRVIC